MKKLLFLFCVLSYSLNAQHINRFRDSTEQIGGLKIQGPLKITQGATANYVLTSNAIGVATWQSIAGLDTNAVNIDSLPYWGLKGNAGTNAATDFIGTTDNTSLLIKTNNITRSFITGAGQFFGLYKGASQIVDTGKLTLETVGGNLVLKVGGNNTITATDYNATFIGNHNLTAVNQTSTFTGNYITNVTGALSIENLYPQPSHFAMSRTYNGDVFHYAVDNTLGAQLITTGYSHDKNGNAYLSMGVEEDTAFTGTFHAYIIVADTANPNANTYYSQTRDGFYFTKNNTDDLFAVDSFGLIHYAELDSATIYALTPAINATTYCTNCSGNGITGRILSYIGSAWRRLLFE